MSNDTKIALKMLYIDDIETYQCCVKPYIQLCHVFAKNERSHVFVDYLLELVETGKDADDIRVVLFLSCCKAGLVDAGVEVPLHPFAYLVDGRLVLLGI